MHWEQENVGVWEQKHFLWLGTCRRHGHHVTVSMLQGMDEEVRLLRKSTKWRSFKRALLYVRIPEEETTNSRRGKSKDAAYKEMESI